MDLLCGFPKKTLSKTESALKFTSYAEEYRVNGFQFIHMDMDVLPNGLSYFVLNLTPLKNTKIYPFSIPLEIDVPKGPITFKVYENTDYVGTVALSHYNPERIDAPSPLATIKGIATGTDKGTFLYGLAAGGPSLPAVVNSQGSGKSTDPTVLNREYKYLVEVNNTTGAAVTANKIYFSWFEVPEEYL